MDAQSPDTHPRRGWRTRVRALRNVPPVLRIVWESGPGTVVAGYALRILAALIPLAMLSVTRAIIDAVVARVAEHGALPQWFWGLVALEFGLAAAGTLFSRAIDFSDALLADKFTLHLSTRIMAHASSLDLATYENPAFYDKLERARVQATDRLGMIQAIGRGVQQIITTVTLAAGIFVYSPWLLLVLIVCVVPAFVGESHFAFLGYTLAFRQTPTRRRLDYLRTLGASKESAKELKLFGLAAPLTEEYTELSKGLYEENVSLARRRLIAGALLSLLTTVGYYGAYAWVIYETLQGRFSVGTLTFLAGAIAGASSNIQLVFSTISSIADQALFLTDLIDFFAVRPTVFSKPGALPAPRPITHGFEFRNVSFEYPGGGRRILDRLSFNLEPGERLALVGENGQGKTTIVKLLTRLYDPTEGQILLDGVDLREYDREDLCNQMAVIFQDFMRYDLSAADNIAMGRISERKNRFAIEAAARKSLAHEVVGKLSGGYDQMLGRRFDGGVDLSGGEWQKLAIARAYLRQAQLLVLDEPTAALDARSEHEVFQRFAELTSGKMALLISHRFSTVKMAERILVLEQGRISEEGPHAVLMARRGRYAELFDLQAASYRQ